jgi:hypothetical protein
MLRTFTTQRGPTRFEGVVYSDGACDVRVFLPERERVHTLTFESVHEAEEELGLTVPPPTFRDELHDLAERTEAEMSRTMLGAQYLGAPYAPEPEGPEDL